MPYDEDRTAPVGQPHSNVAHGAPVVPAQRVPMDPADDPIESAIDAFLTFHAANPRVWDILLTEARDWRARGKGKCGMSLLYSRIRWELSMEIEGDGLFEMNDHYQPFYARALMHFNPELRGMFDLRRSPAADRWIARYQDARAAA